jgi:hypothetical protein
LRFKHPVALAVAAALLTICFTSVVASILWTQSCRYYRSTSALPFINQQLGADAECKAALGGSEGWLLSDSVSYSNGAFSKRADVFYTANLSDQWQRWPIVINATSDLSELYRTAGSPAAVEFGHYMANCTSGRRFSFTFQELELGCFDAGLSGGGCSEGGDANRSSIYPCFRQPPGKLPHVGDITLDLTGAEPKAVEVCGTSARPDWPAALLGIGSAGRGRLIPDRLDDDLMRCALCPAGRIPISAAPLPASHPLHAHHTSATRLPRPRRPPTRALPSWSAPTPAFSTPSATPTA